MTWVDGDQFPVGAVFDTAESRITLSHMPASFVI